MENHPPVIKERKQCNTKTVSGILQNVRLNSLLTQSNMLTILIRPGVEFQGNRA